MIIKRLLKKKLKKASIELLVELIDLAQYVARHMEVSYNDKTGEIIVKTKTKRKF